MNVANMNKKMNTRKKASEPKSRTKVDARELENAVTRLLSLSNKALGPTADPTEHMRYVTQLFTYGKSAQCEEKKIQILRGCYGRLFPQADQKELNLG